MIGLRATKPLPYSCRMVLYDPSIAMRFTDYGIRIPVLDSRADAILSHLKAQPKLSDARWLVTGVPRTIGKDDAVRVHDTGFADRLFAGGAGLEAELLAAYELIGPDGVPNRYDPDAALRPLNDLLDTILAQVSGTYEAARIALDRGFCFFLGGGMHHARRDGGSGFCLLNDTMISIARLRAEGRISTVWVIDVDAHKGDGTAEIALHDPDTLNLSIHMSAGWPLDSESLERAWRQGRGPDRAPLARCDVEIGIDRGDDDRYVDELAAGLLELQLLSGGRRPDLAIVVDGADPYEHDGLLSSSDLSLSLSQCLARDLLIRDFLAARGIPSAWLMAGGYGERAWEPPAAFLAEALSASAGGSGASREKP